MRVLLLIIAIFFATATNADYKIETVADNLNFPWSIAFLPDGSYLVSLRVGEVRRVSHEGEVSEPLTGLPASFVESQGGYFDVLLDPQFETNQLVYLSFAYGSSESNGTRIVRGELAATSIENVQTIFTVHPLKDTAVHYGGKMLFLDDGTLLMTTGDGFEYREAAQDTFSQLGKIIRINGDGSVPADNPFSDGGKGDPKVWSYGHRNAQGLALDQSTGTVYMHEHGPQGGDELNSILPAKNYGWPAVTQGINYSGAYVSPLKAASGVEEALTFWVPEYCTVWFGYLQRYRLSRLAWRPLCWGTCGSGSSTYRHGFGEGCRRRISIRRGRCENSRCAIRTRWVSLHPDG